MMNTPSAAGSWSAMPLCCHYFAAHIGEQPVQVLADDGVARELMVAWALGMLRDGEWEVLGAWRVAASGPAHWRGMFDELTVRGVKGISTVLACSFAEAGAACSNAIVRPTIGRILCRGSASLESEAGVNRTEASGAEHVASNNALKRLRARSGLGRSAELAKVRTNLLTQLDAAYALPARLRGAVQLFEETAEHLGRSLSRAVARHGVFTAPTAATSFVVCTLAQAERCLDDSVGAALAMPARRATSIAGRGVLPRGFRGSS